MVRDAVGRSGSTISYKERELSLTSFESFFCKEFARNAQISPDIYFKTTTLQLEIFSLIQFNSI